MNNTNFDQIFNKKIFENPLSNYQIPNPELNNLYSQNSSYMSTKFENISCKNINSKEGSDFGFNYNNLNNSLNQYKTNQNNADPKDENFFLSRGGNGK